MIEDLPVNPAEPDEIAQVPTVSPGVTLARHTPLPAPRDLALPADSQRYLAAVLRFKWLVLAVAVVVTSLGAGVAWLLKPTYRARAMVWVQVPSRPDRASGEGGPIWSGQLPISSGWTDLLQSSAVLEDVVRGLRLYLTPKLPSDTDALATFQIKQQVRGGKYRFAVDSAGTGFTLWTRRQGVVGRGVAGDSVGAALGFAWVPPPAAFRPRRRVEFEVTPPDEAVLLLAKAMKVSADVDGNFLRLDLSGHDAELVAATVNAVADRFVATAASLKRQKLTELTHILEDQLARARGNLQQSEVALRDFRVGAVTEFSETAGPVTRSMQYPTDPLFAGLVDMKVNREEVRRDREAIERVLAYYGAGAELGVDALAMVGAVQRSTELSQALKDLTAKQAELRALRTRYTDANPPVRQLAGEVTALEQQTIPALARSLVAELKVRETVLTRAVDSGAGTLRKLPPLAVEDARRQREVTLAEQTVANLQQRYEEARLAEVSAIPDVRILDRAAVPQDPVAHLGVLVVCVSLLGGLGLGVLGAVVKDSTDRRVSHPDQVTRSMGITILGAIPHVAVRGDDGIAPVIEAVRAARLNVTHVHGGGGPVVVTVTSPGKADGKSFVSSNLSLAFADAGYRTVLIDGDVRRGTQHHVLKAARQPGLTDYLAGRATLERVVQATPYPGLALIGCGQRTHAGPALLSSAAMVHLVAELRRDYDAIVVDSPPLAVGADAFALSTVTGAMLLVLRSGVSDREMAEAKLEVLQQLPVRVLGAILNDVRPRGAYRYYSYYVEGYDVQKEPDPVTWRVLRRPD